MLVEITLLGECQMAIELILEWAEEGPLLGVDSQMVVEIVPFSEVHRAPWVITL